MKQLWLKVLVFIGVAVGTAFLVNQLNNSGFSSVSRELAEPTLPVVYMELDGNATNRTFGYTQVMSTSLMREGIVPLNEKHGVKLLVEDNSDFGESYTYELRSIAGDSLVERGEAEPGVNQEGRREYVVNFRMDMRENTEYVVVFIITGKDGRQARYYNRVVNLSEQYAKKMVDYTMEFHNTTFVKQVNESEGNMVYDLLKTNNTGADGDLAHVDLTSTYGLVSWGGLNPIVVTSVVPTLTEIEKEYAVIRMSYVIESMHGGVSHYFRVDEYYNTTYDRDSDTVKLLGFDRYMESYFNAAMVSKDRNCVSVGVTNRQAEYVNSANNKKLAFVRMGQLWLYDYSKTSLTNVFSFPQDNYTDVRALNPNVDINVASLDEDGNIYFVVYGYMNRGEHEGKNGLSLYYYSAEQAKITEKFFVESDEAYDIMKEETGRFTYYNAEKNTFYYLLNGAIYQVDLSTMEQTVVNEGIPSEKYLVSENKRVVAYPDNHVEEEVMAITIRNFETGQSYVKSCADTDRLLALGFVENDLIYGISKKSDVIMTSDGEAILPLYEMFIMDESGEQLKDYSKSGTYIMNARVDVDTIYLERATKMNHFFEETEPDFISYKREETGKNIAVSRSFDENAWSVLDIVFPNDFYLADSAKYVKTKYGRDEDYKEMSVKTTTEDGAYYVFNNSGYAGEHKTAGSAITAVVEADEGLVVDSNGNTVYRNLAADSYNTVAASIKETPCETVEQSLMTCAYMCVRYAGGTPEYEEVMVCENFEQAFREYTLGVGVNISGISLDTALYFLDRDIPFTARIDDGRYVLVISYNSTHIRYYDPVKGEEVKVTRKAFADSMSKQSNTLYTFTNQ